MSSDQEEGKSGFRFVDKRRFDSSGNERRDAPKEEQVEIASTPSSSRPKAPELPEEKGPSPEPASGSSSGSSRAGSSIAQEPTGQNGQPTIDFNSFIISLATQALMQLGQIKPPEGMEMPVDKEAARQTIDIIDMLKKKTAGNLSKEEDRLLEEVLHNLKVNFVRAA
ncbi:MAG: hypothetical protein DCC75_12475 [Proteobacteria bacterium]|nr:MAG: hypothetical protein DCC75_12475 [Pseudomonadota bacterium]